MHTVSEMGTSVPAFLGKLWRLVEDPETDDLICWSPNGRSFYIRNQAQFARELLPHYYKHNNMASFVRQLNMYGFHKKVSVELGGLKCDRDEMEFAHQYFCKDHPYLLDHIKRKIASNKTQDPSQAPMKPELMNRMLTEVRCMRGRQEHFDSRLGAMKRENEALWRELAVLRQKHHKQQQIVNKLIHFLASLVQPNRNSGLSMKRRYPLMIDDSSRQRMRQSKISKLQQSPTGPAIHELDASDPDLDSDYIVAEMLDNDQAPTIESPEHQSIAEENMREYYVDEPVQVPQEVDLCPNINISKKRFKGKKKGEEVDTHLDTMQSELENLREILRGEGYSIDANTLLGVSNFEKNLFGAEDPMSFGIPVNPDLDPHSNQEKEMDDDNHMNADQCGANNKGELMTYSATPSLLDFDDDIFLGASSSSPAPVVTDVINGGLVTDPLELADSKGNFFDSLIAANNANSPQT